MLITIYYKKQHYYEHCVQYQKFKNNNFFASNDFTNNYTSKKYSDFDNVEGYQGLCPSFNLIRECFLQYFETQLEDFFDKWMKSLSGEVLSSDHTFKIASFVWLLKNQPFGAFWAVLNEYNEVITMSFVKDKSNSCIKPILEGLKLRYQLLKKNYPWAWYSDQCCIDRKLINSVFPDTPVKKDLFPFLDLYLHSIGREAQNNIFYKQFVRELRDTFFITVNDQKKIPQPKLLEERLINFFEKYNQQKFNIISENLLKQHRENLVHVRLGCISDIENKPSEIIITSKYLVM